MHDRLEQRRARGLHGLLIGKRAGDLEGHFRRVDIVVLPVLQSDAEIDHREAGQVALLARVLDPLLDRGDVLARDRAAEDLVDELEVGAARQRLDRDLAVGELPMASRLLLVPAVRVRGLRDRLAVRHLRRMEDHLYAVLLLQLRHHDLDVELSLSGDEELLRLLVAPQGDGGVFLDDAVDRGAELVLVAARLRLDGE